GDFPAFALIQGSSVGLWELTIFVGLAILAGLVARLFMMSIMVTTRLAERVKIPVWSKPALAGLMVGCIGLVFPQVLGVGYGTTEAALEGQFPLYLLVVLCLVKILATSISLGFGFAGGVFSPALVIGAMLGGAYGLFVDTALPWLGASPAAYTLVGMAAVAAAVLGAPISTALIIFEMTGDFALTLVVMVAVVVASIITRQFHGGSFFHWQLESRGLDLREGFETTLLRQKTVEDLQVVDFRTVAETAGLAEIRRQLLRAPEGQLYVVNGEGRLTGILTLADLAEAAFDPALDAQVQAKDAMRKGPIVLFPFDTLERALRTFRESGETQLAVVAGKEDHSLVGIVHEGSLLEAYNQALVLVRKEERG
ncbi:MAG: chloride channel protein, partial [Rhodospirillales bacterium]